MQKHYLCTLLLAFLLGTSAIASAAQTTSATPTGGESSQVVLNTINLNTADAATLQRELSGIGAAKAKAIVAYREANGNFASIDELLEVKGIGESILENNRDKLSIN